MFVEDANHFVSRLVDRAGIPDDAIVVVHSGFRPFAALGFTPINVAAALSRRFARGHLLMPSMSWRIVTPDQPVFDVRTTPGHVGVLAETFRIAHATGRSIHPTHSVCGIGRDLGDLLDSHHFEATPCSRSSPYGKLRGRNARILMLNCDLASCTAIHHAEELVAPDVYLNPEIETYSCINHGGGTLTVRTRRHRKLNRDFPKFAGMLGSLGVVTLGAEMGVKWIAVDLDGMLDAIVPRLEREPTATLADAAVQAS